MSDQEDGASPVPSLTLKLLKQRQKKQSDELIKEAEEEFGVEGMQWVNAHVPDDDEDSSVEEVEIESETDETDLSELERLEWSMAEAYIPPAAVVEGLEEGEDLLLRRSTEKVTDSDEKEVNAADDNKGEKEEEEGKEKVLRASTEGEKNKIEDGDKKEDKSGGKVGDKPEKEEHPHSDSELDEAKAVKAKGEKRRKTEQLSSSTSAKDLVRKSVNKGEDRPSAEEIMIKDLKQEVGDQPWLKNIEMFFTQKSRLFTSSKKKSGAGTISPVR